VAVRINVNDLISVKLLRLIINDYAFRLANVVVMKAGDKIGSTKCG